MGRISSSPLCLQLPCAGGDHLPVRGEHWLPIWLYGLGVFFTFIHYRFRLLLANISYRYSYIHVIKRKKKIAVDVINWQTSMNSLYLQFDAFATNLHQVWFKYTYINMFL